MSAARTLKLQSLVVRPIASATSRSTVIPLPARRGYATVEERKKDDLGGPYGQESPNPVQRNKLNKNLGFQTAAVVVLVTIPIFYGMTRPKSLAKHQIDNDTVIGAPNSNPGQALKENKHKPGVKTSHDVHREQTGISGSEKQ